MSSKEVFSPSSRTKARHAPLDAPPHLSGRSEARISDAEAVEEIHAFLAHPGGAAPREEVTTSLQQIAAAIREDSFER